MFINRHNMHPYKTPTILWMASDWKPAFLTAAFLFLPSSSLSGCPGSYLLPLEDETMKKQFSELCLHWEACSTKQPESISLFDMAGRGAACFKDSFFFSFFLVEVGGKWVEEGLLNEPWGVDFITGRDVGAGKVGWSWRSGSQMQANVNFRC